MLVVGAPQALAANGPKDNDTYVQLLAINDFHGHLAANTPGSIQVGCCNAVKNTAGVQTGWTQKTVPAGGIEYLATHMKMLRERELEHDHGRRRGSDRREPARLGAVPRRAAIEAMNALGLDVTGVGNHEFDEGVNELLRMQFGGCHPVDGCQDGDGFAGAVFKYLAANVFYAGTDETIFPPYEVEKIDNAKIAFIGLTLEGTPTIVTPSAVAGLEFRPEVATVNALVEKLRNEQGVKAFVVLLHQGGLQNPPAPVFPGPENQPDAFTDVNKCVNFGGAEIQAIANGLDPRVKVVVSAHTHAPYICTIVWQARHERVVVRPLDHVHRPPHRPRVEADRRGEGREPHRDPGRREGPGRDRDPEQVHDALRPAREPRGGRRHRATSAPDATTPSGTNAAGEQPMGDVIADAMLEATAPTDFGGAVAAFMNSGGVRAGLLFTQISGGEQPGQVTYGEAFNVQPFGNTLVVKTLHRPGDLRRPRAAVQQPGARAEPDHARVGERPLPVECDDDTADRGRLGDVRRRADLARRQATGSS